MPFNQQMNSNLVDRTDIQAKHGIFRNRAHVPTPFLRSKLSNNAVPMKPNRNKLQSKILNRRGHLTENDSKIELLQSLEADERNVVKAPSIQLMQDNYLLNVAEANGLVEGQTDQSVLLRVERCKLDHTTVTVSKKFVANGDSSVKLENDEILDISPCEQTSNLDYSEQITMQLLSDNESAMTNNNGTVSSFVDAPLFDANYSNRPLHRKSDTFIKDGVACVSPKMLMQTLVADRTEVSNEAETMSTEYDLKIGDSTQVLFESKRTDPFETELKTYSESLRKYDQEAKDVIDKFTESLNEKGNIIRKYEEELSLFNNRVSQLQTQLVESLERTKEMESVAVNAAVSHQTIDLKSENEKLKEFVKHLETKLVKRDLHIYNLKEVLTIETNKIKELNKAQEEINQLQRDNIDKSREISVLRDELKYAAKMRLELTNEYDEKIVKLKKLLAIREYLLIKGKS